MFGCDVILSVDKFIKKWEILRWCVTSRWPCAKLMKVEKQSEAGNNTTPWSNLVPDPQIKKWIEIEIIWYFRDQCGADERCPCARLVDIKKTIVIKIMIPQGGLLPDCPGYRKCEVN